MGTGGAGALAAALAAKLRALPTPIVGRIRDDEIWLDLRTIEEPMELIESLSGLPNVTEG